MWRPLGLLVLLAIGLYIVLFVLGWWLQQLLARASDRTTLLPTALLGLLVVQPIAWYWSSIGDIGLDRLWPALVAAAVVLDVVMILLNRRRVRALADRWSLADRWAEVGGMVAVFIVSMGLFAWRVQGLLQRGTLSIGSDNNDVAAYAVVSSHLSRHGFAHPGWIVGADLGYIGKHDVNGALSVLSLHEWVGQRPTYLIVLPLLAIGAVLVAQACFLVLVRRTKLGAPVAVLLCVIGPSTFLFVYVSSLYFLAQILSMAMAIGFFLVIEDARGLSLKAAMRHILLAALILSGLLLTYPHMAFLTPPIVLAIFALSDPRRVRDIARVVGVVAAAFLLGCALIPERALLSARRLVDLESVVAGWPLQGVLPWGLVGFQRSFRQTVSPATLVASALLLIGCAAAALIHHRSTQDLNRFPAMPILAVGLGSYAVFYFGKGGPSYVQWKWLSFFQPLIILAIFVPVLALLKLRWKQSATEALLLILGGLLIVVNESSVTASKTMTASANWVSPDLGQLGASPALEGIDELNVSLPRYWETMWAAEALQPRHLYLLEESYFSRSAPVAPWTLVQSSTVPSGVLSQEVRQINATYSLVARADGTTSDQSSGLGGRISVVVDDLRVTEGSSIVGHITVSNVDSSVWLSSGSGLGSVNVGVVLMDTSGAVVTQDFARIGLRAFPFTVSPGDQASVPFTLEGLPEGRHRLHFELVSEEVMWFGDASSTEIDVNVSLPGG
jgi:hypothetical protein